MGEVGGAGVQPMSQELAFDWRARMDGSGGREKKAQRDEKEMLKTNQPTDVALPGQHSPFCT